MNDLTPTIQVDYEGLKRMALEYVQALPSLDVDGLDSGLKCFNLAWLGMETKKPSDEVMARGVWRYVNRMADSRLEELANEQRV